MKEFVSFMFFRGCTMKKFVLFKASFKASAIREKLQKKIAVAKEIWLVNRTPPGNCDHPRARSTQQQQRHRQQQQEIDS